VSIWMHCAADSGVPVSRSRQQSIHDGPRYDEQYVTQPVDFRIYLHTHTHIHLHQNVITGEQ